MAEKNKENVIAGSDALNAQLSVSGGQVFVVRNGVSIPVPFSLTAEKDDLIFAAPKASYVIMVNGEPVLVNEPCPTCIRIQDGDIEVVGLVNSADMLQSTQSIDFLEDELAALQRAIAQGVDPTAEFEDTAAGEVGLGSSISGFAVIRYDYTSVLPEAGFTTTDTPPTPRLEQEDDVVLIAPSGGESLSLTLEEGDLAPQAGDMNYPVTTFSSVLISANSLTLDPNSFVIDPTVLATLLGELTADTKSGGQALIYSVSDDGKVMIGRLADETILTIAINGEASGRGVELTVTVTLNGPLDQTSGDTTGLVTVSPEAIDIAFSVQGKDTSGNPLTRPVDINIAILDGANPTINPQNTTHNENILDYVSEPVPLNVGVNSDLLESVRFVSTPALVAQLASITSNGAATVYSISGNEILVSLASDPSVTVFAINLVELPPPGGTTEPEGEGAVGAYGYVLTQNVSIDQKSATDTEIVPVTVVAIDQDGDSITGQFSVSLVDGDNASGNAAAISGDYQVTEPASEGNTQSANGEITLNAASDKLLSDTLFISNLEDKNGVAGLITELNELTSNGEPVSFAVQAGTAPNVVELLGSTSDGSPVIRLTLTATSASGTGATGVDIASNFELYQPLDESNQIQFETNRWVKLVSTLNDQSNAVESFLITVELQIRDSDNDLLDAPIPVTYTVQDGSAPIIKVRDVEITDPEFNAPASESIGSLGLETGSDDIQSVDWDLTDAFFASVEALTSDGNSLKLLSQPNDINGTDNPINVGYTDASGDTITVLSISLNPALNEYIVTLSQAIDQPGSETVALALGAKVTDSDGDSTSSTFNVIIRDGSAPSIDPVDADLVDPINGQISEQQNLSLGLMQGSDALKSLMFTASPELQAVLSGITSNGYQTAYQPDPLSSLEGSITLVLDDPSLSASSIPANGEKVLSIVLDVNGDGNPTGTYTVTQFAALDEPASPLILPIGVKAVDTDGDEVTGQFTVTLNDNDGEPSPVGVVDTISLTEPDLTPTGNQTGYPESSSGTAVVKATTDRLLPSEVRIESTVVPALVADLNAVLTSGGQPVVFTYDDTTGTLTGKVGSELVMTLSISAVQSADGYGIDITPTLTLHQPLDHLTSASNNTLISFDGDTISINVKLQAEDSDGDVIPGVVTFELAIKDGQAPTITQAPSLNVEESDINANGSGPNSNRSGTTPGGLGSDQDTATGKLVIDSGSDAIKDVSIDLSAFASANSSNSQNSVGNNIPLSSHGDVVTLALTSNNNGTKIYTGFAESRTVFTLTLLVDGTYTFALLGALDHPLGNEKNSLGINFPIIVSDSDNDTATSNLVVNVLDDVPFSLETDGVGVGGGSITTVEGESSSRLTVLPSRNRGADDAVIKSVTINGEQHELTEGVNNHFSVTQGVGGQVLGSLLVQSSGNIQFTAVQNVDHSGSANNRITETFSYEILDGDGDIVVGSTQIVIVDDVPQLIVSNAEGIEDQGRQGDPDDDLISNPADGIPIEMTVDIGDNDQGERVSRVVIALPSIAHGIFYANGTVLAVANNQIVLPAELFSPNAQNQLWTLEGVTFVPDQDDSASSGVPTFTATGFVTNSDHSERELPSQTFTVTVEGIADVPRWDEGTVLYYAINEDSDGAALALNAELQDIDGSETLSYILAIQSGSGSLLLNGTTLTPTNGQFVVSAADINNVVVKPDANFSGDITLTVTAQSKETANFVAGQQTADSVTRTLTVAVNPEADTTSLRVTRATGEEDQLINLAPHISLTDTADLDGSEALFVRISGLPLGAKLLLADNSEVVSIGRVYEVAYTDISGLQLQPPPQSNVDFSLTITGVVKDTAVVTNAQGVSNTVTKIFETDPKTLPIALKGVADVPIISADLGNVWQPIIENGANTGIETTIEEDSSVALSFTVSSGEAGTALPGDNSEALTLLVTNIPAGVTLLDTNDNAINLVYAGVDASGEAQYQAKIDGLSDVKLVPAAGSTKDIELTVTVIATEDDGDSVAENKSIIVHIEPKIDAVDYTLNSRGFEDQNVVVNWRPDTDQGYTDNNEKITHISFHMSTEAIADGYTLTIAGDSSPLGFTGGNVVLTATQVAALLSGANLLLRAPENADKDENIDLSVTLTVTQTDVDSGDVDTAEITGSLDVRIIATVEDDGKIALLNSSDQSITTVSDNGTGIITLASADQRLAFVTPEGINTDGSSEEVISQVIVTFVKDANGTPLTQSEQAFFDQFYIVGGINNGDGSWTVPQRALDSIAISTDIPITEPIFIQINALVQDEGDAGEGDASSQVQQTPIILQLDFTGSITNTQEAATLSVESQTINGVEDTSLNLGAQLDALIKIDPANAGSDELTLVIDSASLAAANASVSGMEFNYQTSEYVAKVNVSADGSVDLSAIILNVPEHFAGDFLLPVKLVTTDKLSGDTKQLGTTLSVLIAPVVDGITSTVTVVGTNGLNDDEQPVDDSAQWVPVSSRALEDGIIELNISEKLIDTDTDSTSGMESITSVALTVDSNMGFFVDANGENPVSSMTVSQAELNRIFFKPTENFSGLVTLDMATTVIDTAVNNDTGAPNSTATNTISTDLSFNVLPVNDPVLFGGNTQPIIGAEDENIALTGVTASLKDTDGSESIVSATISGVPGDFKLISTGGQLVQNSGDGHWSISVPAGSATISLDDIAFVPPANFSGSLTVVLVVYAKEKALTNPVEYSTTVTIDVAPVGDRVDTDIVTSVSGTEDENITLPLDINVVDNTDTLDRSGLEVIENPPENIKIILTNVPDSSSISLPAGVSPSSSVEKQGDGSWLVIADQTSLSSLIFTPGDANELNWDGKLNVSIRAVDNGVEAASSLWVDQIIDVTVSAVNDAPELTVPATSLSAEEETPLVIESIQVKDIDAKEASGGEITVRLSAVDGVINVSDASPIPSGVTVGGAGTSSMQLTGDLDAINTLLTTGITYTGITNFSGQDTITVTVNDNGNTGTGGALTDSESITVNVAPKPDVPTLLLNMAQTAAVGGSVSAVIPLLGLAAVLTDPSETLLVEIRHVPASLTFVDATGNPIGTGPTDGVLTLTAAELAQLHVTGNAAVNTSVEVVTISTTTTGESAESSPISLAINVSNPADGPISAQDTSVENVVVSGHEDATLEGGENNDTLIGGLGQDILIGGAGDDSLWGGSQGGSDSNLDRFTWSSGDLGSAGNPAVDTVGDFNPSTDVLDLSAALSVTNLESFDDLTQQLSLTEVAGSAQLNVLSSGNIFQEIVFTGVSLDALVNDISSNLSQSELLAAVINRGSLYLGENVGTAADDSLSAQSTGESLFGMNGNDTLQAGEGNDILTGGEGNDIFVWLEASLSSPVNTDTVTDLTLGEDKLDISQLLPDLGASPTGNDLLPYFDQATVESDGTINLSVIAGTDTQNIVSQNIVLQNMDISSSGLNLVSGAQTSEILSALYEQQVFKLE
ncbi:retention module-containing protein [Enterovibrio sp. 27052020O]|uniref:retention module-containing protein n=1 Tax=Enterovibrio sp. 27052020O TaxID=3241166 RepID=UPI00388DDE48